MRFCWVSDMRDNCVPFINLCTFLGVPFSNPIIPHSVVILSLTRSLHIWWLLITLKYPSPSFVIFETNIVDRRMMCPLNVWWKVRQRETVLKTIRFQGSRWFHVHLSFWMTDTIYFILFFFLRRLDGIKCAARGCAKLLFWSKKMVFLSQV